MVPTQLHYPSGDWIGSIVASLLVILLFGPGAWAQGPRLPAQDTRQRRAAPERAVIVHDGRLSVDVQAVDLSEVLAQIGQQAGIRIAAGPSAGKKVSARFADVELEEGFRRLLRLASLSHLFLYAQGPAGTAVLTEVRVVGAGTVESGTPVRQGRQQAGPRADLPEEAAAPEAPEPVVEVVETAPEPTPAEPSEAMRRVLDAFSAGNRMKASPPGSQTSAPPEATPEPGPVPEGSGADSK